MNLLDYYEALRSDIWKVITGTKNADSYGWDSTTPNKQTRKWLRMVLRHYLREAFPFGLYTLFVHEGCSNPNHRNFSNLSNVLPPIMLGDERYKWLDFSHFKENVYCECGCFSLFKNPFWHYFYETAFFDNSKDTEIPSSIGSILNDVVMAILCASDKMPRSGIREYLLRAIVKIDSEKLRILSKKPSLAIVHRKEEEVDSQRSPSLAIVHRKEEKVDSQRWATPVTEFPSYYVRLAATSYYLHGDIATGKLLDRLYEDSGYQGSISVGGMTADLISKAKLLLAVVGDQTK